MALALVAAACGGDDDPADTTAPATTQTTATTQPTATTAPPETTTTAAPDTTTTTTAPAAASSPVVLRSVDFDAQTVEIANIGSDDYDLSGHWLCNRPSYTPLPDQVISPGETVILSLDGLSVSAESGELGLYTAQAFDSSDAIVRYVEWGNSGHGRSGTAVEAGVWGDGDFVDNGGANLVTSSDDPASAADWSTG